ncbi:MAG TPA: SsrA-binding protein SmpB [Verrucomicrobiota bacterium]|nr:SsrA-binding protein SmpB [Verrucomicrobiota bacterium]HNU51283.1 SsrA-binding protein SmpB [Verrucomicrobiota bacterium]
MADIVTNPKARRDYEILETLEAGLVLRGTEVKSLRAGLGQLADAFARVEGGEAFLYNAHIDEYRQGNRFNHEPKAPRKLLLHQREIRRLREASEARGLALVALSLYWKQGRVKVALGVGRSKQRFDKRQDLKERETERELRRVMQHRLKGRSAPRAGAGRGVRSGGVPG